MVMTRIDLPCRVVVPDHKAVRIGTLRKIISQAGISVDDFLEAVDGT
jgi:predicted RNA binding protein YcfA (HicA-like mRNA interferase family)